MGTKRRKLSHEQYNELKQDDHTPVHVVSSDERRRKKKLSVPFNYKALYLRMYYLPLFDSQLVRLINGFLSELQVGTILCRRGKVHQLILQYWIFARILQVKSNGSFVAKIISAKTEFTEYKGSTAEVHISPSFDDCSHAESFVLTSDLHYTKNKSIYFEMYQPTKSYINEIIIPYAVRNY